MAAISAESDRIQKVKIKRWELRQSFLSISPQPEFSYYLVRYKESTGTDHALGKSHL